MASKQKQLDQDLLKAVAARDIRKISDLLEQGADIEAKDKEHRETLLILAVKYTDSKIVRLLLDAGACVNSKDSFGRAPLFYAAVKSEIFTLLVDAGADIHAVDDDGNTVLMYKVSKSPSWDEINELLRRGISKDHKNNFGESARDLAEDLGLIKIIEKLETAVMA